MNPVHLAALLMIATVVAAPAVSQEGSNETRRAVPEVMTKALDTNGKPIAPWIESEKCIVATKVCKTALLNLETGEIARFGDDWVSGYKKVENGLEISLTRPPVSRGRSSKAPILEE